MSQTQADMDMYGVSEVTARARDKGYVMLEGYRRDNVKGFFKNVVGGRAGVTEYYMYDATNIRLRELSVGYQLPAAWMEKTKVLKRAQLSFSGRRLLSSLSWYSLRASLTREVKSTVCLPRVVGDFL